MLKVLVEITGRGRLEDDIDNQEGDDDRVNPGGG
jgi:hypothetical protein